MQDFRKRAARRAPARTTLTDRSPISTDPDDADLSALSQAHAAGPDRLHRDLYLARAGAARVARPEHHEAAERGRGVERRADSGAAAGIDRRTEYAHEDRVGVRSGPVEVAI